MTPRRLGDRSVVAYGTEAGDGKWLDADDHNSAVAVVEERKSSGSRKECQARRIGHGLLPMPLLDESTIHCMSEWQEIVAAHRVTLFTVRRDRHIHCNGSRVLVCRDIAWSSVMF